MTRRKESCLGCGQMLVAVPAGGGWAHLSLALPISLFSTVEKATDGVRRFCSGPSAASSVCPALSRLGLKAPCQGNMGTAPGTQPSTAIRVNCLQRGVAPPPLSPTNTLLPPRGCKQQLHLCFEVLAERRHFFIQTKHALSRSLCDTSFEIIKMGRLHVSGSFFNEIERESEGEVPNWICCTY